MFEVLVQDLVIACKRVGLNMLYMQFHVYIYIISIEALNLWQ